MKMIRFASFAVLGLSLSGFMGGCATAPVIRTNLCAFPSDTPVANADNGTATVIAGHVPLRRTLADGGQAVLMAIGGLGTDTDCYHVDVKKIDGKEVSSLFADAVEKPSKPTLTRFKRLCRSFLRKNRYDSNNASFHFWEITACDIPAGVHQLVVSASGRKNVGNGELVLSEKPGSWSDGFLDGAPPGQAKATYSYKSPLIFTFSHNFQAGHSYQILMEACDYQKSGFFSASVDSVTVRWYLTEKVPADYSPALQHLRSTGENVFLNPHRNDVFLDKYGQEVVLLGEFTYKDGIPMELLEKAAVSQLPLVPPAPTSSVPAPPLPPAFDPQALRELKELKEAGILTDEEYEAKRKALVERMMLEK